MISAKVYFLETMTNWKFETFFSKVQMTKRKLRDRTAWLPTVSIFSRLLVFIIGFLIGFSDFCVTMARAVICQVAVPDCRMQVFSLSKLYQVSSLNSNY